MTIILSSPKCIPCFVSCFCSLKTLPEPAFYMGANQIFMLNDIGQINTLNRIDQIDYEAFSMTCFSINILVLLLGLKVIYECGYFSLIWLRKQHHGHFSKSIFLYSLSQPHTIQSDYDPIMKEFAIALDTNIQTSKILMIDDLSSL